jgi:hypothetical protein
MRGALLPLLFAAGWAQAAEGVALCYNYGCLTEARIEYSESQLAAVGRLLDGATDAGRERSVLALAVGMLYGWAGEVSPIAADRGGDFADDAVPGRMDCIDHATSTTRLLQMLEARGWLRFHRVLEPARRAPFIVNQHFSAVVEQTAPAPAGEGAGRYAVDSWFYDNGMPAVVLPLDEWLKGAGPDV